MKLDWRSQRALRLWIALVVVLIIHSTANGRSEYNAKRIKTAINELKKQLGIGQDIRAIIVPKNAMVVSVEPVRDAEGVFFQMSFEEAFLNMLDNEDLRAVVAHELGHVWIFTHHPYLQTEQLANTVAFRAISTSSLDRVYDKMRVLQRVDAGLEASLRIPLVRH